MINVPYEDMPREIEALLGEIEQLQQENQRLKKANEILKENAIHNDKVVDDTNWKIKQYKSILDEIREYIEKDYIFAKRGDIPLLTKDEQLAGKIFEILDKVGSNE